MCLLIIVVLFRAVSWLEARRNEGGESLDKMNTIRYLTSKETFMYTRFIALVDVALFSKLS